MFHVLKPWANGFSSHPFSIISPWLESQMNHWELLVGFGRQSAETPFILWLKIWLCLKIGAHYNPSKSHIHDFLMSFYQIGERVQRYMTSSPLLRVVFFLSKARSMVARQLQAQDWWCPQLLPERLRMMPKDSGHDSGQVGKFRRSRSGSRAEQWQQKSEPLQLAVGHGST